MRDPNALPILPNAERRTKQRKGRPVVSLGLSAAIHGVSAAAKSHMVSKQSAYYWKRKLLDPLFHPKKNGGIRRMKFLPEERLVYESVLWSILKRCPQATISQLVAFLHSNAFQKVNYSDVRDCLVRWRWSYKVPSHIQLQKYSEANCRYYAQFLLAIQGIEWTKLKFLDEAHFVSRDLFNRKAWGPVGKRCFVYHRGNLSASFSMTMLTSLSEPEDPLFISLRSKSNTQYDFLAFIVSAIEHNKLHPGDLLIVDNATVHGGQDTFQIFHDLITAAGVQLVYLPTYSPELNPVELCWNIIKKQLSTHRNTRLPFWVEILNATAKISFLNLISFYYKCTKFPMNDSTD